MKEHCTNLENLIKKEVQSIPHTKKYREIKLQMIIEDHEGNITKETVFNNYCMTPEFLHYAEKYRQKYCGTICDQREDCELAQKYMRKQK